MAYQRKTRDYWSIQQYTGAEYKWEEVCAEDSRKEANERLKEYRANQPEYPVRARRKRERITPEPTPNDDLVKALARTPEQQTGQLAKAIGFKE